MATIYICDGCKKEINHIDIIKFWGSKVPSDVVFCEQCFKSIESYIIRKYQIESFDLKEI